MGKAKVIGIRYAGLLLVPGLACLLSTGAAAQVKQDTIRSAVSLDSSLIKDSSVSRPIVTQVRLMTEGTITYKLQPQGVSPQEEKILEGSSYMLSLKGSRVRTDFMGPLGITTTIYSSLTHAGALLQEYGQEKILVRMSKDDFEDFGKPYRMTYTFTGDSTIIAGYPCKKALGHTTTGDTLTIWYSPDLLPQSREYNFRFNGLPGLPLRYEGKMGNTKVLFQATRVSLDPVPGAKFEVPKTGYRELSYTDSKKLQ